MNQGIRDGIERLAQVARAEANGTCGLSAAQARGLEIIARWPNGLRVSEFARQLGVSQPSATDTTLALAEKGLIRRCAAPDDARVTLLIITPKGSQRLQRDKSRPSALENAIAEIPEPDQERLLLLLVSLVRKLQEQSALPLQRMCLDCKHFVPNRHGAGPRPHHCAFVDSPIGWRDLRIDCADQNPAAPESQSANWALLHKEMRFLQAPQPTSGEASA